MTGAGPGPDGAGNDADDQPRSDATSGDDLRAARDDAGDVPPSRPAWAWMIAPLRSEDAAFRTVLWVVAAAVVVVAVTLVVRALS